MKRVITTFIGRNRKIYPVYSDSLNLFLDAPEDKNPYYIIFVQDDEIKLKGVINKQTVESLERRFGPLQYVYAEKPDLH